MVLSSVLDASLPLSSYHSLDGKDCTVLSLGHEHFLYETFLIYLFFLLGQREYRPHSCLDPLTDVYKPTVIEISCKVGITCMCVCLCTCHGAQAAARGHATGVTALLTSPGCFRSYSGLQAWQQGLLPTELSHQL